MASLGLIIVACVCGFAPPTWNTSQTSHDERLLGINAAAGPALIERFRNNMLTAKEADEVRQLIERLAADDYRQREKAHQELIFWRAGAEAVLKRHEFDLDIERRRRVRLILEKGLGRWSNLQAEAAARLLRNSPSAEAVRVLIEYVPYADDPGVQREIAATLRDFASQNADFAATIRTASKASDAHWLADEKSKEPSPTLQALDRARNFFSLVAQAETDKLVEATRLPFAVGNGVILTSPKERDEFFKQAVGNYRDANPNAALTFLHVTRGEDYVRFATDQEREFLANIPPHEIRAVHVRVRRDWQNEETGAILVRVGAQGAIVIGLGQSGIRGVKGK